MKAWKITKIDNAYRVDCIDGETGKVCLHAGATLNATPKTFDLDEATKLVDVLNEKEREILLKDQREYAEQLKFIDDAEDFSSF